jgi:hypothetical protein
VCRIRLMVPRAGSSRWTRSAEWRQVVGNGAR